MAGILDLMGYVQGQGDKGRERGLAQLVGKAYNAPPEQRQAVLGQVANVDGPMAMDAQAAFGKQDDAIHDQIIKRAAMVSSLYKANPQMAQAAYQGLPELAQRGGFGQVPAQLDDNVAQALEQMVAAARQVGSGGNVQSTYIDAQGNRVAIMRDGTTQVLGANAPNNQIIDTGNGFFGVNKGNLQAAPVITGGAQPPPRAPGEVPFSIDPSLPPEVQADIRANESAYAGAPDGAQREIPSGAVMPGQQLRSAPKPAAPAAPSALEERIRIARQMGASDDEIRQIAIGREGAAAGAKPMPVSALRIIKDETDAANTATQINSTIGKHLANIESGKLDFGMASNLLNQGKLAFGRGDEEARNFQEFKSDLEKLRNDSLRLNNGVQTDGDAQRAWNELVANLNDTSYVKQRLQTIQRLNERAAHLRRLNADMIRENYGRGEQERAPQASGGFKVLD